MPTKLAIEWAVGQRLGGEHFGAVHEVDAIRVARLIPADVLDKTDGLRARLLDRAEEVGRLDLPHVTTPLAWGQMADGAVYLVERRLATSLAINLKAYAGLPTEDSTRWFLQLLDGLAALHARKISHGDVRPENVFLDSEGNGGNGAKCAWLTDAAVGHLWWWSQGEVISPAAADYSPPEWAAGHSAPTPQTDLYMLGMLACEMYLGRNAVAESRDKAANDGDFRAAIKPRWKRAKVPGDVRRLLGRLLEPQPSDRPADAVAARREYDGRQRRRTLTWAISAAFAAILLIVGLSAGTASLHKKLGQAAEDLRHANERIETLQSDVTNLKRSFKDTEGLLRKTEAERDQAVERLKEAEAKLAEYQQETRTSLAQALKAPSDEVKAIIEELLEAQGGTVEPPDVVGIAQDTWREKAPAGTDAIDSEKWPEFEHEQTEVQACLNKWYKQVEGLRVKGGPWFDSDTGSDDRPGLCQLYLRAAKEPWTEESVTAAETRLKHLEEAARQFHDWAYLDVAFGKLKDLIDDPRRNEEVNSILKTWYLQFGAPRSKPWTLQLTTAKAPEGWGTTRQVYVQGSKWIDGPVHDWQNPTGTDYGDEPYGKMDFAWKPGEATGVILYGERSVIKGGARRVLIDAADRFQGPLSVWLMHVEGRVTDPRGFELEAEIVDCPGPPKAVIQGLMGAAKQELGGR